MTKVDDRHPVSRSEMQPKTLEYVENCVSSRPEEDTDIGPQRIQQDIQTWIIDLN
jgi:hypothetical protein